MGKLRRWLHSISDNVLVYLATVAGVAGSIAWPWIVDGAMYARLPVLGWPDLIRFVCAGAIGIVLAVRADRNPANGEPANRMTKAAVRRRVKAAFSRGFAWQAGISVITALASGRV